MLTVVLRKWGTPTLFQRLLAARAGSNIGRLIKTGIRGFSGFLSPQRNNRILISDCLLFTRQCQLSTVINSTTVSQVSALINSLCDSSSEHEVVREYLSEVTEKVLNCSTGPMTAQNVYDVMFGLQGMV